MRVQRGLPFVHSGQQALCFVFIAVNMAAANAPLPTRFKKLNRILDYRQGKRYNLEAAEQTRCTRKKEKLMILLDEVKNIRAGAKISVVLLDGTVLTGEFETYTSAIDNDPAMASIDLKTIEGIYELYENEIKTITML